MKTTEINFKVTVDENNLPSKITWSAPDAGDSSECKSLMIALWDAKENNTLRIDLWTKDMMVDEMKKFFHQNVVTLTDTYVRATGDENTGKKVKQFFSEIGKEIGVLM
ncbi:MAG: gliding motility protein GldC [Bacteroidia bacterium]|nr:gliding motility protein GldC [Bacteroidia bacterium]